jgi:hypothetical protein
MLLASALIAATSITVASAADDALPKDTAVAIQRKCAADWPDDFRMRVYCEDR